MEQLTAEQLIWIAVLQFIGVLLAPLLALQIQKRIESFNQKRERKLWIFRTLMATRGSRLSLEHIQALNLIPVEFYGNNKKEQAVLNAWEEYRDFLAPEEGIEKGFHQQNEYFLDLLDAIAKYLNYNFRRIDLRRNGYTPQGFVDTEQELTDLRRALLNLVGRGCLPVINVDHLLDSQQPANDYDENAENDATRGKQKSTANTTKPESKIPPEPGRQLSPS